MTMGHDDVARVYLDAATAAPLHPAAKQAIGAAIADGWADPSRLYSEASRARLLLDAARAAVADAVGVAPEGIAFQPSGTAAAHAAVLGGLAARRRVGNVLVQSAIEHSAVLRAAQWHEEHGGRAQSVPVTMRGVVDEAAFAERVREPGVALAALMAANHEVGTVQPVAWAADVCEQAGVPLYVDASAALGWAPIPTGWSLLSASARKWGGPAGVGVLAFAPGARWHAPWPVDERELNRGMGPIDIPLVVGAAAALRARLAQRDSDAHRLSALVDHIREQVPVLVPDVEVVGDPANRLPHIVTFSCLYVDGEALVHAFDARGFAVSSGSSCTSSTLRPSHVLEAMGVLTHGNVRLSLHPGVTQADVDRFLAELPGVVAELRARI